MRRFIALALLVAIPLMVMASDEGKDSAAGGKDAPAISLKDTTGKNHSLDQYKDKIVVLEWTEPGCPYIVRHAKAQTMSKIQKDYAGKNVVVLGVCTSKFTDAEGMEKFRQEQKLDYPVLMDETGAVGRAYGASNTPHLFVVQNGKIVYEGAIDDDPRGRKDEPSNYVDGAATALLQGALPAPSSTQPYGCSVKYAD